MTNEQIKELWEACGFKFFQPVEGGAIDVIDPSGDCYLSPTKLAYPPADLNNLFEFAVPRVRKYLNSQSEVDGVDTVRYPFHDFMKRWVYAVAIKDEDPTVTLFNVCYEVLVGGKE